MSNCGLCNENKFKMFNFSCGMHLICVNCIYKTILTSNFSKINLREFFLICPVCKNGEIKISNDDLINELNDLIENQKFFSEKICEKHNKKLINFCEKCDKFFCNECLTSFHNDFFPEHFVNNNNIISKKSINNFKNYDEFKFFSDNKKNEILNELNDDNIFFINKIDEIIKKFQQIRNKKKNENENLKSDFNKLFEIINKIYFIYYTSNDENFTISNSITEIKLIKQKSKIDYDKIFKQISIEDFDDEFETQKKFELFFKENTIEKISTLKQHNEGITKIIKLNFPENSFATAGKDSKIFIWTNYNFSYKLESHKSSIWSLFQNSNNLLFSGSSDKTIKVWKLEESSGLNLFTLKGHKGIIYAINEMKNKNLISISDDRTIKIWSIFEQKCLKTLFYDFPLTCLCVCPYNDDLVFTGDENNTISIWNVETDEIIHQFKAHQSTIWSLNLFDNERFLISAGSDDNIKIWDIYNDFILVSALEAHENTVSNAIGMKNGLILSSSWDGSVKISNPFTKECVFDLKFHNGIVWDVAELDDGNIVSVGNDCCVNVYEKK